jgi:hypothetical protein
MAGTYFWRLRSILTSLHRLDLATISWEALEVSWVALPINLEWEDRCLASIEFVLVSRFTDFWIVFEADFSGIKLSLET